MLKLTVNTFLRDFSAIMLYLLGKLSTNHNVFLTFLDTISIYTNSVHTTLIHIHHNSKIRTAQKISQLNTEIMVNLFVL